MLFSYYIRLSNAINKFIVCLTCLPIFSKEKKIYPYDKSPLYKIKRIISSSPDINLIRSVRDFMNRFKENNYICNEFQFKNLIRELNIGLTNIEIEDILKRSGKTYNGLINIKELLVI